MANNTNKQRLLTAADIYSDADFPLFKNDAERIKYMKKAGSLVITISTIGDDIFIVLKDTGEGLNEEETKHIFELNFQGSNRISGNGLGLALVKRVVDIVGGEIGVSSELGKGTTFTVKIKTA